MNASVVLLRAHVNIENMELDRSVLEGAQKGNELACRELFGLYHQRVFAFLWRMLGQSATTDLVEDLEQDTFIRVFAALPKFSPEGSAKLSSWIMTVAYRLALNDLSKRKVRSRPVEIQVSTQIPPEATLERKQMGERLRQALDALPSKHRAAFLLYEYHGMDYQQVAQSLDMRVGTVKSRLSRARAQLRESLKGYAHD
jgi:RNA polymerase sigma-70 factor, ECF subfamily